VRKDESHSFDRPRIVTVDSNKVETAIVNTLSFKDLPNSPPGLPGQFIMVWLPGIDEVPMSLTQLGDKKAIAFHHKGQATEALFRLKKGDRFGIRGPYGHGFELGKAKHVLIVGGGTGIAALASVMGAKNVKFTFAIGAKTASELLYASRIKRAGCELVIATDDGTKGFKGFVSVTAIGLMKEKHFDLVLSCGPEVMMKKMAEHCVKAGIPIQCSTERYMKCGVGICDSCSMGGLQVCKDGPIFTGAQLLHLEEFGKWKRGPSGKRERLC
jgi:dihydroorotate dehydrogenase electron transfer subunit